MDEAREARAVAADVFGYDRLRPGQEEAMAAVAAGRDALVVMPTGGGKSAIYQVAGQLIDGPTIVVSPLIALQRDQVGALRDLDAGGAREANSTMADSERDETFAALQQGDLEFVFVAPEQLANEVTLAELKEARPSLMVVDEAHCISSWGHDFRPDYLRLGEFADELGRPVMLALTATAAPPVRDEIVSKLRLRDPLVVVKGFERPNIFLAVSRFHEAGDKDRALIDALAMATKPGIVYAATRADTEALAASARDRGVRAASYHAGLKASERHAVQDAFMADDVDVVVATVAFGMGIDKPNVRFVYHHAPSESLDAYYQEIGRAGRDGDPAEAHLFFREADLGLRRFFAASGGNDENRKALDRSRVEMMRGYGETTACRTEFILTYFGEPFAPPCGHCDNCFAGTARSADTAAEAGAAPFAIGSTVVHDAWGAGQVLRYDGDTVVVLFESVGYKTLSLALVTDRGLLTQA